MKILLIALILGVCYVSAEKNNCSSSTPDYKWAYDNIKGAGKKLYNNCLGDPNGPPGAHATLAQLVKQMSSYLAHGQPYRLYYKQVVEYLLNDKNRTELYMADTRKTIEYIFKHIYLVKEIIFECYDDLVEDCDCNERIAKGLRHQRHIGKLVLKLGDISYEFIKAIPFFDALIKNNDPVYYKDYIKSNPPRIEKLSYMLAETQPYMRPPNSILNKYKI